MKNETRNRVHPSATDTSSTAGHVATSHVEPQYSISKNARREFSLVVAALLAGGAAGCATGASNIAPVTTTHVKCTGINACKGLADCAMKDTQGKSINVCGGMNECREKGWLDRTDKACAAEGGTPILGSERQVTGCSSSEPKRLKDELARNEYLLEDGVGVKGYDPVGYFPEGGGKAQRGDPTKAYTYIGVTYYFSSDANLERFKKNPTKYEPAYGGWCAYGLAKAGKKVDINPEAWRIEDGRLLLFYRTVFGDTYEKWGKLDSKKSQFLADSAWYNLSGECHNESN